MTDSERIFPYDLTGGIFDYVTVTVSGFSSSADSNVKLKLNSAPNKVWIIFCDYINDDISVKSVVTAVP